MSAERSLVERVAYLEGQMAARRSSGPPRMPTLASDQKRDLDEILRLVRAIALHVGIDPDEVDT